MPALSALLLGWKFKTHSFGIRWGKSYEPESNNGFSSPKTPHRKCSGIHFSPTAPTGNDLLPICTFLHLEGITESLIYFEI